MTTKQIIVLAGSAALAIFGAQAAGAMLGAKEGTLTGAAIKIAGGAGGLAIAGMLAKKAG